MAPLRVLIVDDEALARCGCATLVRTACDPRCEVVGEAATRARRMESLQEHGADLVLLDIQMPGATGLELAAAAAPRRSSRRWWCSSPHMASTRCAPSTSTRPTT
jgi:two-component system response regulator AlgR